MLKKLLKFNLSLVITTPTLVIVSCGPNETLINFNDMNNLIAYKNVFSYKDENNEEEIGFSLFPQLKESEEENIFNEEEATSNPTFLIDNNNLKLNCKKYLCSSITFKGNPLTYETYNKIYLSDDYIETTKIQFSYDFLAKTFNVIGGDQNLEDDSIFYDFSNNSININYEENSYYFNQIKPNSELILISNQEVDFFGNNNSTSKIDFYDQDYFLTKDLLIELTANSSLTINDDTIVATITEQKEKDVFLELFFHFDNELVFELQENEQIPTQNYELENENEVFVANFKNDFKIDKQQITKIELTLIPEEPELPEGTGK